MLGTACLAGACFAYAATTTAPPPATPAVVATTSATAAASAASAAQPTRREQPPQSPAVRAAQGSAAPGDLRPQSPVVPQLAVPLRRDRDTAAADRAGSAGLAGAIHDAAARCKAATSDRERAACIRSGNVDGTVPKR